MTHSTPNVAGVEELRRNLEAARNLVVTRGARGNDSDIDDLLCAALDIVVGWCGPHLRILPSITWFAARDANGGVVIEYMPARDVPYHVVMWADNMQIAEFAAKLMIDNERSPTPRMETLRGERLSDDDDPQAS